MQPNTTVLECKQLDKGFQISHSMAVIAVLHCHTGIPRFLMWSVEANFYGQMEANISFLEWHK